MRVASTVGVLTVMLFGCGGSSTSPTAPEPFVMTQSELIGAMTAPRIQYEAPRSGKMSLEVSWANPEVNIDLYMTPSGCLELTGCGILERSDSPSSTRELISRSVVTGEQLTFYVVNRSQVNHPTAFRFAIE